MKKRQAMYGALLSAMLLLCGSLLMAQQTPLEFDAPQFMLPMYDHFTDNLTNAAALGRGHTVNAATGNIETAQNNPANLIFDKNYFYLEICIKPTLAEIDNTGEAKYASPVPFGMLGLSAKLHQRIYAGISYAMPKSVEQDDFHIMMNQGNYWVVRYPSYNQHQFTGTLNADLGAVSLGLNLHNQIHNFEDTIVLRTFDRVDYNFYSLRIQPGISYHNEAWKIGASVTLPTETEMDMHYVKYNVTQPLKLSGGIAFKYLNNGFYLDADWEQFSQMQQQADDRLTLKAGYEKRMRNITYRAGIMQMPGVYQGSYLYPVNTTASADTSSWWDAVPTGGNISKTDQFFVTGGFTYYFKGGELTLALMQDFIGKVPTTRFLTSLGFDLNTFKRKKFLIFE